MKPRALSLAAAALAIIIPILAAWQARQNRQDTTSSIVLTERELWLNVGDRNQSAIYLRLLTGKTPDNFLSGRIKELGLTGPPQKPRRGYAVLELRDPEDPPAEPPGTNNARRPPGRTKPTENPNSSSRLTPVDVGLDPQHLRQQWPGPDRYLIVPAQLSAHRVTTSPATDDGWQLQISLINGRLQVPAEWRGFFLALPMVQVVAARPAFRAHIRFGANYEPWLESAWVPAEPPVNPAPPPLSLPKP